MKIVSGILLITMLPSLSGCIFLAAGAGGATGYYVSTEDKKEEKLSSPQADADSGISARVRDRFSQDPQLAGLIVATYQGTVTLSGDVPNGATAQRAIDAAHGVDGVKSVQSELTVH